MSKRKIRIELSKEEEAIAYAEKTIGRNKTIQKRAAIIYYASKGAESMTELAKECGLNCEIIRRTLNGYKEKGIAYIYECSRGIKKSVLDLIEAEVLEEFENNPPSSIPEAVSRIEEKFGIILTDTPVRYWLKKKGFDTSNQSRYLRKQT